MCGRILARPHIKLPFRRSLRPWTSSICLRLPAGLTETDQIRRWECLRLVDFEKIDCFLWVQVRC